MSVKNITIDGRVIIILAIIIGFFVMLGLIINAYSENYTYNMTKDEREEFWLSDICINTSIKIPNCEMITGKIGSDYGEAIESAKQK